MFQTRVKLKPAMVAKGKTNSTHNFTAMVFFSIIITISASVQAMAADKKCT